VIDPKFFRQVLGQYPTGVVVVTTKDSSGAPIGMTVGSFTSVSLDPPLVAFLPDRASNSWKAIREAGESFCINVLGAHQEHICRAIATRKQDKFDGIRWHNSPLDNPVIDGSVAFLDCHVDVVHDAGDHQIVLGRVEHLDTISSAYPLMFFRGGYGSFRPLSLATADADLLEQLKLIDTARPYIEQLAQSFNTEVNASCLVRDELVLAAAAGSSRPSANPTRVGLRVPFMPPVGAVFAAWGGPELEAQWVASAPDHDRVRENARSIPERVRARGYAATIGHQLGARFESASILYSSHDPEATEEMLRESMIEAAKDFNPPTIDADNLELRSLTAPVFDSSGGVAFSLSLWGPPGYVSRQVFDSHVQALLESASAATAIIGGRQP
jgi:flavin reductase (DIM6/NTAB) family NADH-FMN oxidoreductase RutF/DNA-binding IclR family transcriptional regulator